MNDIPLSILTENEISSTLTPSPLFVHQELLEPTEEVEDPTLNATVVPSKMDQGTQPPQDSYSGNLTFFPSQCGLGNNLYGLVSAFVFSALLNLQLSCTSFLMHISISWRELCHEFLFQVPGF